MEKVGYGENVYLSAQYLPGFCEPVGRNEIPWQLLNAQCMPIISLFFFFFFSHFLGGCC